MAHFVNSRYQRISGTEVNVALRRSATIGVWGAYDFDGNRLQVESTTPTVARVVRTGTNGDYEMYRVDAVALGEAVVEAKTGAGTVWDSMLVRTHRPGVPALPRFANLVREYPLEDVGTLKSSIGGEVDSPDIDNSCVLRVSRALNYTGARIPLGRPGLAVRRGADSLAYAIRVSEFLPYLTATYGPASVIRTPPPRSVSGVQPEPFIMRQGIIAFEIRYQHATGHFTLWNGVFCLYQEGLTQSYFDEATRVSLWEC